MSVGCAMRKTSRAASRRAASAPSTAARSSRMSCWVSMRMASAPPSMRARACSKKIFSSASPVMEESAGSEDDGQHAGRAHRAGHEAGLPGRGVPVGGAAGQDGGPEVHLVGAVAEPVLVELEARRAEGVGLHHVAAGREVPAVDGLDQVRAGEREQVVRPLLASEVGGLEVEPLDSGSPWPRRRRGRASRPLPGTSRVAPHPLERKADTYGVSPLRARGERGLSHVRCAAMQGRRGGMQTVWAIALGAAAFRFLLFRGLDPGIASPAHYTSVKTVCQMSNEGVGPIRLR